MPLTSPVHILDDEYNALPQGEIGTIYFESKAKYEYHKAPEVTRKRLYLETMEAILPGVEKVIIEPGTTSVLPYLPLGRGGNAP